MPSKGNAVIDQYAMTPKQALAAIADACVKDAARLIRDHAAAGLIRSYAQLQMTITVDGGRLAVRGGKVQPETWEPIVAAGADADIWCGGTVRLPGSDLIGGAPTIHVTGIAFHPGDVARLANQHRPPVQRPLNHQSAAIATTEATSSVDRAQEPKPRKRRGADSDAISSGAILCTVKQAGDALGIGRTKVNELMNSGRLERAQEVAGVRITVASVRVLAGLPRQ